MHNNKPKVIGIILAYRHAKFLEKLYKSLPLDVLDEVIITNDDTGDNIEEIASHLGIPCYSHSRLGYGGNLKYGLKKAMELGADYMVEIHGDGQFDPSFIPPAIEKMNEGYDFVLGTRFIDIKQPLRDKMPLTRYLANIALSFIDRIILRVHISEFNTGARLYNRKTLEAMDLTNTSNDHLFSFQIIAKTVYYKFKIGEVSCLCHYDQEHSSISLKRSVVYAFQSFYVLFLFILARLGFKSKLFK